MKNWFFLVSLAIVMAWTPRALLADKPIHVNVIAPAFAPLQMNENGKVKGYVVDLVRRVIDEV